MKKQPRIYDWIQAVQNKPTQTHPAPIVTDPNGSYTGRASDPFEKPVQDADDL